MSTAEAPPRNLRIAMIGNPNTGKSTLFNRLTGARQRIGNYPGVTVERKIGRIDVNGQHAELVDLPGTYSLAATSEDERIAVEELTGRLGCPPPEVVVCVVDASNLMRNLFLVSQVAELVPVVVALNMSDAARGQGISIDIDLMERRLGVRVVPTVATRGEGIEELRRAIADTLESSDSLVPVNWPPVIMEAAGLIAKRFEHDTGRPLKDFEARRLLFDIDSLLSESLGWRPEQAHPAIEAARDLLRDAGLNASSAEAILRYGHISELLEEVITHPAERRVTTTESVDRLLTHRVWGLVFFVVLMTFVFQSIYRFAVPFMDGIDIAIGWLGGLVGGWLASTPMVRSLIVDGVIAGVGSVIIFLPQILILFFFVAVLETTGYMARAAFLMDKLFSWCGLNGKSFVPLLSSYACAVPGVMAARSIEDRKARLVTILIAPLMSCSARLPVYVLLIGAFLEPQIGAWWAGLVLVGMHVVGLIVAIPVALVLNRWIVRGRRQPFVMEMPPYRAPQVSVLIDRMWRSAGKFLTRAGTIIFAMTIIIWALTYFPRDPAVEAGVTQAYTAELIDDRGMSQPEVLNTLEDETTPEAQKLEHRIDAAHVENSYLGRFGRAVQPVFDPAGFDWKITVGVLASFPAREVIIATVGVLYGLGGDEAEDSDDLMAAIRNDRWDHGPRAGEPVYTPWVAVAIMMFFALCLQCGSTVAVIARESNWGWAIFAFCYMTVLAWLAAVVVYQIGRVFS